MTVAAAQLFGLDLFLSSTDDILVEVDTSSCMAEHCRIKMVREVQRPRCHSKVANEAIMLKKPRKLDAI
jgi:hypothetical protein